MGDIMAVLSECQRRFGLRVDQSHMPDRYCFGTLSFARWQQSDEGRALQSIVDGMKDDRLIKVAIWKSFLNRGEPAFSLQRTADGYTLVFDAAKINQEVAGSISSSGQKDRPDPRRGHKEALKKVFGSLFRTRNRISTD